MRIVKVGFLIFASLLVGWCTFWSVDYSKTRREELSPGLVFVERTAVMRSAWSLGGGDGGFFAFPAPSRFELTADQWIERGGARIWTMSQPGPPEGYTQDVDAVLSPDGKRVALVPRNPLHTLQVLDLATLSLVSVADPPNDSGHDFYGRWLRFTAWSPDSRTLVTVHDDFDAREPEWQYFRDVWYADAATGSVTRGPHCEGPKSMLGSRREWPNTPCAGEPRPRF